MFQYLKSQQRLSVQSIPRQKIQAQESLFLHFLFRADGIKIRDALHLSKQFLPPDFRIDFQTLKMRKIFFIQIGQLLVDIQIPIQVDIAVGRMIIAMMELQEHLLRKPRYRLRIAARLVAVGRIREQRVHDLPAQQILCGGQRPLHFIVNHAAVAKRLFRAFDFIVPALLHEDFRRLVHRRVKDRIQIDIHEVLEILVIAACHRINRLVRVGHRIQKGVQRALHQLHKGLLQRILARAAKRRMLHDVRDTRIILGRRAERNGKHLVVILVFQIEKPCTCLFMHELKRFRIRLGNILLPQQAKPMQPFIHLYHIHAPFILQLRFFSSKSMS